MFYHFVMNLQYKLNIALISLNTRTKHVFTELRWSTYATSKVSNSGWIPKTLKIDVVTLFELPSFHTVTASQVYLSHVVFTLNHRKLFTKIK